MVATLGGVPGSSLSSGRLDAQASVLAATSAGFSSVPSAATTSIPQSKVGLILLYLRMSLHLLLNAAAVTAPLSLGDISSLAQTPVLRQPFVVGPGSSPVPCSIERAAFR